MKLDKTTLVAIAVLLLAGIVAVALMQKEPSLEAEGTTRPQNDGSKVKRNGPLSSGEDGKGRGPARSRTRVVPKDQELVVKFGESRTILSREITSNIVGILEDAVQMGELMQSGQGAVGGLDGRGGLGMVLGRLNGKLALTDAQEENAAKILADYQERQLDKTKNSLDRLKKDPTSLMQLMLANDASARGEIQDEEYKRMQTESGKVLAGVLNPLNGIHFGYGSPFKDEAFVSEFKSTLDADQRREFDEAMAVRLKEYPPPVTGVEGGSISTLPKMELEKLDTSIQSSRKLTTSFKRMMEGFGGLKGLAPLTAPRVN